MYILYGVEGILDSTALGLGRGKRREMERV
jgi:hypothetical protein